jgi:WD40 repeat protein/transcriptional regulator with XRE-family HTH domain
MDCIGLEGILRSEKNSFQEMLEQLRVERGISKSELAKLAGLTPGYISHLTLGERRTPSLKVIEALTSAFMLDEEAKRQFFDAAGLLSSLNVANGDSSATPRDAILADVPLDLETQKEDWNEAPPNTQVLHGRQQDLLELKQWIMRDRCQMVAIVGIGGVGKTLLTASVVEEAKQEFDVIFWRSLQHMPPLEEILRSFVLLVLRHEPIDVSLLNDDQLLALFTKCIQTYRCVIILDNFESVLQSGDRVGLYQRGYEGYGKLLQRIGSTRHMSCLLLTSREKPKEFIRLEGKNLPVRSKNLSGIPWQEAKAMLESEGITGSAEAWKTLIEKYSGNPLILKLVTEPIRELFQGDIQVFLSANEPFLSGIHDFLDQLFQRLSPFEWEILYWLAVGREAVFFADLAQDIVRPVQNKELLEALESLKRRSLIETRGSGRFTLQPVIMEYVTEQFVEKIGLEIMQEKPELLMSHALMKAQGKEYIRAAQVFLILKPVLNRLKKMQVQAVTEQNFASLLDSARKKRTQIPDYVAGNVINLLVLLDSPLKHYDFTSLWIRQAYLQGVSLEQVNFTNADIHNSVFTDAFGSIFSVAVSATGEYLAAGTSNGEVRLWHLSTRTLYHIFQGHTDWVRSVSFSPDSSLLISGSYDDTIRVWDIENKQLLDLFQTKSSRVFSVAFSPDGKTIVAGCEDHTLRLWSLEEKTERILTGHSNRIWSVAFSPDGTSLISGSEDHTVRIWDVASGECVQIMNEHQGTVWSVAVSATGRLLATGCEDRKLRIWDMKSGKCLHTLSGHASSIQSVAFSHNEKLVASGSEDQAVCLWNIYEGQCLYTLTGHTNWVYSVAFTSDDKTLVSGSEDRTIRFWEVQTGYRLGTIQGHTNGIYAIAFSPDGKTLAAGGEDRVVRLWDVQSGALLRTLKGHDNSIRSVAFSPDGVWLASGSEDQTVRLWSLDASETFKRLPGHRDWVYSVAFSPDSRILASAGKDKQVFLWDVELASAIGDSLTHNDWVRTVAFSPDGNYLASGSEDQTIRLWDIKTRELAQTLRGQTGRVYSVAFSKDGKMLAGGGEELTVGLWNVETGDAIRVLPGHDGRICSVAFSPQEMLLASGSEDQTIRLWDVNTAQCRHLFQGHHLWVYSVAFSPNGKIIASGSGDRTIRFWDVQSGKFIREVFSDRPYERLNITGVRGLRTTQKASLFTLGAFEI